MREMTQARARASQHVTLLLIRHHQTLNPRQTQTLWKAFSKHALQSNAIIISSPPEHLPVDYDIVQYIFWKFGQFSGQATLKMLTQINEEERAVQMNEYINRPILNCSQAHFLYSFLCQCLQHHRNTRFVHIKQEIEVSICFSCFVLLCYRQTCLDIQFDIDNNDQAIHACKPFF